MVDLDDSQVKVEPTTDSEEICSVFLDEDIYNRVTDKFTQDFGRENLREMYNNLDKIKNHIFLGMKVKDKIIGILDIHDYKDGYEVHVAILKPYRHKYAVEAGAKALQWVFDNKECDKLYAHIPVLFPEVRDFAFMQGFELDHIDKQAHLHHDNKKYDVWAVSLERNKWLEQ